VGQDTLVVTILSRQINGKCSIQQLVSKSRSWVRSSM